MHAVAAEVFDFQAEPLEHGGVLRQRLALRRRQLEHDRREQPLALERARGQLLHHLLEEHALVRHVLIDDRDALVVDGDDVGVAELAERDHRPDLAGVGRQVAAVERWARPRFGRAGLGWLRPPAAVGPVLPGRR